MYTTEGKYNRKRALAQTKRVAAYKVSTANYDRYASVRVTRKKKARAGVLPAYKKQGNNIPKHSGAHRYCVLCKKAGTTERKWKYNSSKKCFGKGPTRHQ